MKECSFSIFYCFPFDQASFNPDEISLDTDEDEDEAEAGNGNMTFQSFCSPNSSSLLGTQPTSPSPGSSGGSVPATRRKLELPPPTSTTGSGQDEDEEDEPVKVQNAEELKLLESVFGKPLGESCSESENPNPLFVIDTRGEPELKRRRNESFYKEMDD
jgi:hypothetical protein